MNAQTELRPLEPGCIALILRCPLLPQYEGTQCTAEKLIPADAPITVNGELFRTNCPVWLIAMQEGQTTVLPPEYLLRLDGYQPEADELLDHIPALARLGTQY